MSKPLAFKKVAIIGKHYKKTVSEMVESLYHKLTKLGFIVTIEKESAEDLSIKVESVMTLEEIALTKDVAIIIGGDGNFLQASRKMSIYNNIPVIGVNKGKLGFLTTINSDEESIDKELIPILNGENSSANMFMLKSVVDNRHNVSPEKSVALNEIAITAGSGRMFGLKVFIDGWFAFDQRGDGLIIATPTGSTAHAMSAGGPILNPNQNSIVIVPICSHSLNSRPLVISSESRVDIIVTRYNDPSPVLSIDGRNEIILKPRQKVTITKSQKKVKVLHTKRYNYYDTLRNKLGWSKVLF